MKLDEICVVVTSRNDEHTIRRCLESTRGFGSRLVVDAFSNDGTVDVARDAGAVVYSRPALDAAAQKNWAVARTPTPTRWVLSVDASESVDGSLIKDIERADESTADGWVVRVDNEYLGKVMTSSAASFDGSIRLFVRDKGRFVPDHGSPSGASCQVEGRVDSLNGALRRTEFRDFHIHFEAINRDTTAEAQDYVDGGGRLAAVRMLLQPALRFWHLYIFRGGIRDGARGLMFCMLRAYAAFITYAKAWELSGQRRRAAKTVGKENV